LKSLMTRMNLQFSGTGLSFLNRPRDFARCSRALNLINPLRRLIHKFAKNSKLKAYTFCLYVLYMRFAYTGGENCWERVRLFRLDAEVCGGFMILAYSALP
jgi:hypothetical protein